MIVQCINNETSNFSTETKKYINDYIHLSKVSLIIGKKYIVYGLLFRKGVPWYYICEEDSDEYPLPHFCGFFKVINPKLSSEWEINYLEEERIVVSILPSIWSNVANFYENLVNGNENETSMFQNIKSVIDSNEE